MKLFSIGECGDRLLIRGHDSVLELIEVDSRLEITENCIVKINGLVLEECKYFSIIALGKCDDFKVVFYNKDSEKILSTESMSCSKKSLEIKSYDDKVLIDVMERSNVWYIDPKEAVGQFPIWKVEFEKQLYKKGNDIRDVGVINYYCKEDNECDWNLEYSEEYGDIYYAFCLAGITLAKLREWHHMKPDEDACMFEYNNSMFKMTHYFDVDKSYCGDAIDDFYNEYERDNSIKVDCIKSHVRCYRRGTLVMNQRKLYLDCKVVMTSKELEEVHGFDWYQVENMYGKSSITGREVTEVLGELFKDAKKYSSWAGSGYFKR